MKKLITDRLILREVNENDIEDIYEYSRECNVGPNAGWKPHESLEESKKIAEEVFIHKENIFGIIFKKDNKLIGTIGLVDDPKRENDKVKMIGYAISEKYWGKGIMTEAVRKVTKYGFEKLKLDLISAYCYPFNNRSRNVLEKCKFQYEGTLELAEKLYTGEVYDNLCFALKKEI